MSENEQPVESGTPEAEAPAEAAPEVNPQDFKKVIAKRDRFKSERDELAAKLAEYEKAAQGAERKAAEGDQAKELQLLQKELAKAAKERDELLSSLEARDKKDRNRAVLASLRDQATDTALVDAAYEKLVREGALEDGPEDAVEASKKAAKVMRKRFSSLFKPNTQPPANAGQPGVIPGAAQPDPIAQTAQKVDEQLKQSGVRLPPGWLAS